MVGRYLLKVFDLMDCAECAANPSRAGPGLGEGDQFWAHPAKVAVFLLAEGASHNLP